jgi:hypothetical protein
MSNLLKILENVKNGLTTPERAEKQIHDLLGKGNNLNQQQVKRVSKTLDQQAKDIWVNIVGSDQGFKEWYKKRNEININ